MTVWCEQAHVAPHPWQGNFTLKPYETPLGTWCTWYNYYQHTFPKRKKKKKKKKHPETQTPN